MQEVPGTIRPEEPITPVAEPVSTPEQNVDILGQSVEVTDSKERMQTDEKEIIQLRAVDADGNILQSVNLQVSKGMSGLISPELFKFLLAESQQVLVNTQHPPIPDDIAALSQQSLH